MDKIRKRYRILKSHPNAFLSMIDQGDTRTIDQFLRLETALIYGLDFADAQSDLAVLLTIAGDYTIYFGEDCQDDYYNDATALIGGTIRDSLNNRYKGKIAIIDVFDALNRYCLIFGVEKILNGYLEKKA